MLARLSEIATSEIQMLRNIFLILSLQLMKGSSLCLQLLMLEGHIASGMFVRPSVCVSVKLFDAQHNF